MSATASEHHSIPDVLMDELLSEITQDYSMNSKTANQAMPMDIHQWPERQTPKRILDDDGKEEEATIQQLQNIIKLQKKEIAALHHTLELERNTKTDEILSIKTELSRTHNQYTALHIEKSDIESKCSALRQTIEALREETGNQQKQIVSLQNELERTQFEAAEVKMDHIQLTSAVASWKQKHVLLTEDISNLYASLVAALSFGQNAMCGWYQKQKEENDEIIIFPVRVKGNKIGYLDGTIESNKETQTAPYVLEDTDGLCEYVLRLREYTESSLSTVDIPQNEAEDESENKNDFLLDLGSMNMMDLTKQQSIYNCLICMDAKPDMFNYPCGHASYCNACAVEAIQVNTTCPNCRQEITQCLNIFSGGFKEE